MEGNNRESSNRAKIVFGFIVGIFGLVVMAGGLYLFVTAIPGVRDNDAFFRALLCGVGGFCVTAFGAALVTDESKGIESKEKEE